MNRDLFEEKLNLLKDNEKPEVVLLIANNDKRIRLIVAWMNTKVTRTNNPSQLISESENEIWDWLWKNSSYSMEDLIVRSAVSSYDIEPAMKHLIANRIIYPDGTVNSYVQRYLRERVLKLFEEKPKKKTANSKM